jgi:predicted RNase H-like HicB family nuclease
MKAHAKSIHPPFPVVIEYSDEDKGYVARVPALKYCTAYGATYEEAAHEIESAIMGWLETAKAHGTPIPQRLNNVDLRKAAKMLNLTALAKHSGISTQTLFTKLRRRTALRPEEVRVITRTLNKVGLHLVGKSS